MNDESPLRRLTKLYLRGFRKLGRMSTPEEFKSAFDQAKEEFRAQVQKFLSDEQTADTLAVELFDTLTLDETNIPDLQSIIIAWEIAKESKILQPLVRNRLERISPEADRQLEFISKEDRERRNQLWHVKAHALIALNPLGGKGARAVLSTFAEKTESNYLKFLLQYMVKEGKQPGETAGPV